MGVVILHLRVMDTVVVPIGSMLLKNLSVIATAMNWRETWYYINIDLLLSTACIVHDKDRVYYETSSPRHSFSRILKMLYLYMYIYAGKRRQSIPFLGCE